VLKGAKARQEIYEAFDNIYPILKSFKKQWIVLLHSCCVPHQKTVCMKKGLFLLKPHIDIHGLTTTWILRTDFFWTILQLVEVAYSALWDHMRRTFLLKVQMYKYVSS
jgi:hypothetical protein